MFLGEKAWVRNKVTEKWYYALKLGKKNNENDFKKQYLSAFSIRAKIGIEIQINTP